MWQSKWVALNKRSQVSLTFGTKPLSHKVKISRKYDFGLNSYRKMNFSIFFPYKCIRNQIWPCHIVGQARFIICANLVETTSPMLHTKAIGLLFQRIRYLMGFYPIWMWRPWPLKLIYSHCHIRFNIWSENNDFGFNSIHKINISKNFTFKYNRKQIWPWP